MMKPTSITEAHSNFGTYKEGIDENHANRLNHLDNERYDIMAESW